VPDLGASPQATAFAILDVETTGLQPEDRIIEVAVVRLARLREVTRFETLVNPGIHIPLAATAVCGIDDDLVSGAPEFPFVWPVLETLLSGAVLVAHNASFDLAFLSAERKRAGLPTWKGPVLDTLKLARNTCVLPSYSLHSLHESLALESAPSHRALSDVLATAELLRTLLERLGDRARTLGDLLAAQEPVPVTWEDFPESVPQEVRDGITQAALAGGAIGVRYETRTGVRTFRMIPKGLQRNGPLFYLCGVTASGEDQQFILRMDRIRGVEG